MSNLEKVVENAVADDVNQDCEKVVMQQITTSLVEKIKAKKKVLESQVKPALDSFNEISSKAEHLEKKRRAVEITFTKLFQEFEPIEDALDSAKEGYADKAGEDGQILVRGLEEAHTLIRKCNALETKNNILRPQMESVISEHDRLKKEFEESDAKHKQLLTLLAQKKAEYESLIPLTADGSLNTSTPRKEISYRLHRVGSHFVGTEPSVLKYHMIPDKKPEQPYGRQGTNHLLPGFGKVNSKLPTRTILRKDKVYTWCSCGHSGSQPLCDGSHNMITTPDYKLKPVRFIPDRDMQVFLCNCKQTKNRPFCDGSHKHIKDKQEEEKLLDDGD
uniref:Iron-binding zinc finger CDGSH type domain-containing protein n=1 Tax=Ditylenchus dipsaci TaxID=166011 RepID=A0A915DJL8_9BILA